MNRLSPHLVLKLCNKLNKSEKYVREQISKRARRESTLSEVALVKWAKELGIPTSVYIRSLPSSLQSQIHFQPSSVHSSENTESQTLRIVQIGRRKDQWYNQWWIQWFVVGLLIATISGTLSQVAGSYLTNLLGLTKP